MGASKPGEQQAAFLGISLLTCADVRSLLFLYTASLCTTMGTDSPHPPARLLHTLSDPESVLICDFVRRNPYGETAALGRVDPVVFSGSGKTMVVFFSTPISVSVCDAGLAWESLVRGNLDGVERDRFEKALLEYCGQDTLALIKLVERLQVAST